MKGKRKWHKCEMMKNCYNLEIFGGTKDDYVYAPPEMLGVYFPKKELEVLLKFDEILLSPYKFIGLYSLHVHKLKTQKSSKSNLMKAVNVEFSIDKTDSLEIYTVVNSVFRKGKFIRGVVYFKEFKKIDEFKAGITEEFHLEDYDKLRRFFLVDGLPQNYRNEILDLI